MYEKISKNEVIQMIEDLNLKKRFRSNKGIWDKKENRTQAVMLVLNAIPRKTEEELIKEIKRNIFINSSIRSLYMNYYRESIPYMLEDTVPEIAVKYKKHKRESRKKYWKNIDNCAKELINLGKYLKLNYKELKFYDLIINQKSAVCRYNKLNDIKRYIEKEGLC